MQKTMVSMAKGTAIVSIQSSVEGIVLDRVVKESRRLIKEGSVCGGSSPRGSAGACSRPAGGGVESGNPAPLPSRNRGDIRKLGVGTSVLGTSVAVYVTVGYRLFVPWIGSAHVRSAQ